ncbi:mCG145893, partial [Mus musculus]
TRWSLWLDRKVFWPQELWPRQFPGLVMVPVSSRATQHIQYCDTGRLASFSSFHPVFRIISRHRRASLSRIRTQMLGLERWRRG